VIDVALWYFVAEICVLPGNTSLRATGVFI
jgi:hypothetical protein